MFGNGKVFISHTHADNAACAPVLAALDAWQVDYWFDLAQLSAGLELLEHIQRGLQDRDIFIRICTSATLASTWTAQEQLLARTMRAPNRGLRRMINLIVQPDYIVQPNEVNDITIDTTRQPEVVWMRQLREALEIPSRARRVSRRAVLGVGITSLAALGSLGLAGKLLFFTPLEPNRYLPIGHRPTATPLPGTSRIRWRFSIYPQPFLGGVRTNIALAGQTIITAGNSTLTAAHATDGTFLWIQRQYDINTDVPPLIVGNSIYVTYREPTSATDGSEIDKVYIAAFSVADGSQQWRLLVADIPVQDLNFPSASAITLDADATTAYVRVNQTLYACNVKAATVSWSQSAGTAAVDVGEVLPAPVVAGDAVYAVLGDHKLHAFAATSGAPLWPIPFATALPIHTQPVVANGLVYTGADGGWCYALDAATGTIHWEAHLLHTAGTQIDPTRFTSLGLTLHENVLYISGGFPFDWLSITPTPHAAVIQALDPTTGKILWSRSPSQDLNLLNSSLFRTSPVIAGNSILMASALYPSGSASTTILYALNPQSGKVKWNLQVPGIAAPFTDTDGVPSAPVVSGDAVYLISGNEMLYALSYGDNG